MPTPVANVITLQPGYSYYFVTEVDLLGSRIICGENTAILGTSSENAKILSTGLIGVALISSSHSLPMRNISIEADIALELDATGNPGQALDWFGVNFINSNQVGIITNYNNFILQNSAFINSGNLILDGTINTIAIGNTLFNTPAGETGIFMPNTFICNRRMRIIYSSFIVGVGATGINVQDAVTSFPNPESFILDTVNFSGVGTYLTGISEVDTQSLIVTTIGVANSANIAQFYMLGNATGTPTPIQGNYYKILGTTIAGSYVDKFDLSVSNRALYNGALSGFFKVSTSLSFIDGNNQIISVVIAVDGVLYTPSETRATTSVGNRAENVLCQGVFPLNPGQYVEMFIANNTSGGGTVTVTEMNFIIERLV